MNGIKDDTTQAMHVFLFIKAPSSFVMRFVKAHISLDGELLRYSRVADDRSEGQEADTLCPTQVPERAVPRQLSPAT